MKLKIMNCLHLVLCPRHPIRGKDPLPSKVMDLIEVIPVPSTAPAAKPATIQSRDDIEPRNEPR